MGSRSPQSAVNCVGGEISPIGPGDGAEVVNKYLAKFGSVAERLKHRAKQAIVKSHYPLYPILKHDFQTVAIEWTDGNDFGHGATYSRG